MFSLPLGESPCVPLHHRARISTRGVPGKVVGGLIPLFTCPSGSCSSGNHWGVTAVGQGNSEPRCFEPFTFTLSWPQPCLCQLHRCDCWDSNCHQGPSRQVSLTSPVMSEHSMVQFKLIPSNCQILQGQFPFSNENPHGCAFVQIQKISFIEASLTY